MIQEHNVEQEIIQAEDDFKIIEHADIAMDDNLGILAKKIVELISNEHDIKCQLFLSVWASGGGGGGDGGDHAGDSWRPDCQGDQQGAVWEVTKQTNKQTSMRGKFIIWEQYER